MSYIVTLLPSRTTDHLKAVCDGPNGKLNCSFPMEIFGVSRKDFANSGVLFEVRDIKFINKPSAHSIGYYKVDRSDILRVIPNGSYGQTGILQGSPSNTLNTSTSSSNTTNSGSTNASPNSNDELVIYAKNCKLGLIVELIDEVLIKLYKTKYLVACKANNYIFPYGDSLNGDINERDKVIGILDNNTCYVKCDIIETEYGELIGENVNLKVINGVILLIHEDVLVFIKEYDTTSNVPTDKLKEIGKISADDLHLKKQEEPNPEPEVEEEPIQLDLGQFKRKKKIKKVESLHLDESLFRRIEEI